MILSSNSNLSIFHDAKIGKIDFDYINKSVYLNLTLDNLSNKGKALLTVLKTSFIQFQSSEPWGPGIYISKVDLEEKQGNQEITILLNSGDTFQIIAEYFELKLNVPYI